MKAVRRLTVRLSGAQLGYLHIKDTFGIADRDQLFPRTALHPVTRVRIDTPLDDTLTALRADGSHLTAVMGDQGTVLGFVTMEDVLTELVGPSSAAGHRTLPHVTDEHNLCQSRRSDRGAFMLPTGRRASMLFEDGTGSGALVIEEW